MKDDTQISPLPVKLEYGSKDALNRDTIALKLQNPNDDSDNHDQESEQPGEEDGDDGQDDKQLVEEMEESEKVYEIKSVEDYKQPDRRVNHVQEEEEEEQPVDGTGNDINGPSATNTDEPETITVHDFIKPSLFLSSNSQVHILRNKDEPDDDTPGCTQTRNFSLFSDGLSHSTEGPETARNNDDDGSEDDDGNEPSEEASPPRKRRRMFAPDDYREASPDKALHTSLHHALLGQSLTKTGQESVDQERVAHIIYEATKGSAFFLEEQRKDERLTQKIERILALKAQLDKTGYKRETRLADEKLKQLEASRDLSQIIVQVDCDAFYASVEELDNPSLKDIPFGVGQGGFGVLTTANYKARKFGVRSGMAEHVAKKLCPELTIIPPDYRKYLRKSREIRAALSGYDDRLEVSSIDECYLNITDYCEATGRDPESVVTEMRQKVAEATHVTVSAGITPNDLLSKIASNRKKPNGQFRVLPTREACMDFMADLPCRKVPGIGKSWERQLNAIGIQTVKDIYPLRGLLEPLFKPAMASFLLQVYLGLGRTNLQPSGEYERKSVGTERTFAAIQGHDALVQKMKDIARGLEHDMASAGAIGRKLTLRLKFTNFQSFTRQRQLPRAINKQEDIFHFALPLLKAYENEFGTDIKIRLLGLRLEDLTPLATSSHARKPTGFGDLGTLEADIVKRGHMELPRMPTLREIDYSDLPPMQVSPRKPKPVKEEKKKEDWACPICGRGVEADDKIFNEHVDACLNKDTIKEVVRGLDDVPFLEPPLPTNAAEVIPTKKAPSTPPKTNSERKRFFESPSKNEPPMGGRNRCFDSLTRQASPATERKRFFQSPIERAEKRARTEPPESEGTRGESHDEGRLAPPKMLMLDRDSVVREGSKSPRGRRRRREAVGLQQVVKGRGLRGIENFFKK